MKRILLTSMSGTGKSTLTRALLERGQRAVDVDCPEYSHWVDASEVTGRAGSTVRPNQDWVWREDRVEQILQCESGHALFVSGCAANMRKFLTLFDHVVLLSAPEEMLVRRLGLRSPGSYGANADEIARVLELRVTVEPLLRRVASLEIQTTISRDEAVKTLLRLADGARNSDA